ncbi:porin [Bradyrhizobium roseum]|uniref:porin n=1 Tax=Bradyrhizobium roseum TaxID=3056648 RepID=UPI00260E888E|nr:porin [Bradyrhizobium roseus]WKA25669.1 porin [Bradyrhizobium roseus]
MRKFLLVTIALALPSVAADAEPLRLQKADKVTASDKPLPLKRPGNACAEYGAGFVRIEGTTTCMKIGGAVSVGAGVSSGSR